VSNSSAESAAYLTIVSGMPAKSYPLARGASVAGRSPGVAIVLSNVEISRQHCRFEWDGERCLVDDLGSIRGTTVNGEKINVPAELRAGDRIGIGPALLEFTIGTPRTTVEDGDCSKSAGLLIMQRGVPTERIKIEGELIMGRDPQADVLLADASVSRRHVSLKAEAGGCIVTDLHSTTGSFINGHRFDTHELTVGDRLQVGPFCFQYDGQALVHIGAPRGGSLTARDVTRIVGERVLLDGISFTIAASQFCGILGPSGAGKSTLLHALAGLDQPDAGHVLVDGEEIYVDQHSRSFGYVPQDDIVHRELTVHQALRYSARLRLPSSTPDLEIQRLILQTMERLGLEEHADKPIGRLSGGQRKRVSVGVELLAKPAILFLDEPSSGLDPATEFHLMELLRELADTGCTIICTTHVVENAYLMDQFLVLAGGCLAFQGDAQAARTYFGVSKLVLLYDRLLDQSPQEWKEQNLRAQASAHAELHGAAEPPAGSSPHRGPTASRFALPILLQRQWAILAADWRNFAILFGQPLVVAALVLWATTDQVLALFFTYIATLWFGCSNAAQEIVKEVGIYRRERLVGIGTHSYLIGKFVSHFGIAAAQGLLLLGCVLAVFKGSEGNPSLQALAVVGIALAAVAIGFAISSLARSMMQAVLIVPLVLIPQILFSGYTVKAWEMTPAVYAVARTMPTFASQTIVDTAYLLDKKMTGDTLANYATSLSNLNRDHSVKPGDTYTRRGPILFSALTYVFWAVTMYIVAWLGLRRRESR